MPKPTQYQSYAEPLPVPAVPSSASWHGYQPEAIARRVLHAALIPAFFWSTFTPVPPPAAPELSWQPEYPDRISIKHHPTALQEAFFYVPAVGQFPVPTLSWQAAFP